MSQAFAKYNNFQGSYPERVVRDRPSNNGQQNSVVKLKKPILSGYMLWLNANRPSIIFEHFGGNQSIRQSELISNDPSSLP